MTTTRKTRFDAKTIIEKHEQYKGAFILSEPIYTLMQVLTFLSTPFLIIGLMYVISNAFRNGVTIWNGTVVTSGFFFIYPIAFLIVGILLVIAVAIITVFSLIKEFKAYFWEKKYDELLRR